MCHANKHYAISFFMCTWIAETFLLQLTCPDSTVDRICAPGFLLDITYFNYWAFLVHGHYSAFLLLGIYSQWPLLCVSVTQPFQALSKLCTRRFYTLRFTVSYFSKLRPFLLAHSKNELIQWWGVRRLSVCKLLRKALLLAGKWSDRHQTFTRWTPGQRASRMCSRSSSRSKVTWYGHFCAGMKIASRRQMAGSRPNLHMMVIR